MRAGVRPTGIVFSSADVRWTWPVGAASTFDVWADTLTTSLNAATDMVTSTIAMLPSGTMMFWFWIGAMPRSSKRML